MVALHFIVSLHEVLSVTCRQYQPNHLGNIRTCVAYILLYTSLLCYHKILLPCFIGYCIIFFLVFTLPYSIVCKSVQPSHCFTTTQVAEQPALLPKAYLYNFCMSRVHDIRFGTLLLALRNVHSKRHGCCAISQHVDHASPKIGGVLVGLEGGAEQRCA